MDIYGLQKLTLLDYPEKAACTLFTGGCNFRCPFCHNASLVYKTTMPLDRNTVIAYLRKRRDILDGVCVTGGEPLMHDSIEELLEEIKGLGYLIKIDTNGCFPEKLKKLVKIGCVDYIAMDIKNSPSNYQAACGIENIDMKPILESVNFLLENNNKIIYEFRTIAVKGIHKIKDFYEIGDWIAGAEKYFLQNFEYSSELLNPDQEFNSFSLGELKIFLDIISKKVKQAAIRGTE